MKNRLWNKKSNKKQNITVSDIVRGIQHCVNTSVEILERHFITQLDKYADSNNNVLKKTIIIDEKHAVDIPLFCLSDHNALNLDEMEVKVRINLLDMDIKEINSNYKGGDEPYTLTRSSFNIDESNFSKSNENNIDLRMKFKAAETPEAICRISEKLANTINVYSIEKPINEE